MLSKNFKKFINKFDGHTQELISGASVALVLKIIAGGIAFLFNIVLARLLGAEGSGIYFLTFTIVLIMAGIGTIGMENTLVRFIAANSLENKYEKVLGVYKKATLYSFIVAGLFSIILFSISPWISQSVFNKPELGQPLRYMSLAILPLALLNLHAYALQGLKKIAKSISVLSIFIPLITGIIAIIFVPNFGISAAVMAYILSTFITLAFGFYFWRKAVSPWGKNKTEFDTNLLFNTSLPLLGINVMNLIIMWSPIIFLGMWSTNEDVGIYNAASRTAMLTSFVLIAVNSIAAPKFAELYNQGDISSLGNLARNSAKLMMLIATPILLFFIIAPEYILSLFGNEFKSGSSILIILALGQFVNVVTGSVGYLLMMSGNEKIMRNNLILCGTIGIFLNIVLIKNYGAIGGAVAASVILALQNLIALFMVKNKLGINVLPIVTQFIILRPKQ